jgi:hypothetical protein
MDAGSLPAALNGEGPDRVLPQGPGTVERVL